MHARHSRGTPGDQTLACRDRLARLTALERQTFGQDREAVVLNLLLDRRPPTVSPLPSLPPVTSPPESPLFVNRDALDERRCDANVPRASPITSSPANAATI